MFDPGYQTIKLRSACLQLLKANSESSSHDQSAEETVVSVDLTDDAPMPGQTPPATVQDNATETCRKTGDQIKGGGRGSVRQLQFRPAL